MSNLNFDPSNQSQKIKRGVGVVVIVSRKVKSKKEKGQTFPGEGGIEHIFKFKFKCFPSRLYI